MDTIQYADFAKVEIRMGEVTAAEVPEGSNHVIKLTVDFGSEVGIKTIFSGIKAWYSAEQMVGKKLPFVVNLEPKKMGSLGYSEGMLMAAITGEGEAEKPVLLEPTLSVNKGDKVI
jgi:methionyl-tRNA synthetase